MNLVFPLRAPQLRFLLCGFVATVSICICSVADAADSLPSWNDGAAKTTILEFVAAVTDKNSNDYVPPADRIATFDNDGT